MFYRSSLGVSFVVAALGRPVALTKMRGVASPNHELRRILADGAEDVIAAAEYLVGGFKALFDYVVCAAHCDLEIRGWGAVIVITRAGKPRWGSNNFTVKFNSVAVDKTGLDFIKCDRGSVSLATIGFDRCRPMKGIRIISTSVGDANKGRCIGLNPDLCLAHV